MSVLEPLDSIFHPDSYGYRPGRNVDMALSRVCEYMLGGFAWVVDADILDCFENIPHDLLIKVMESVIHDHDLIRLIIRWLSAGNAMKKKLTFARGIPQGAVLSPFLCNLYLSQWDYEISARGIGFVRYADDLLVFGRTEAEARTACLYSAEALSRLWLELNPEKTQVVPCGSHVVFLGQRLPDLYIP